MGDLAVFQRLMEALGNDDDVKISIVAKYENLRGLLSLRERPVRQIRNLNELVGEMGLLDLIVEDWDAAAKRWAGLRQAGTATSNLEELDGDGLIAAQARRTNRIVVTDDNDFQSLSVETENWKREQS